MSLELVKEAVRLNQPIGMDTTQTIVENDIIVPDVKPDIARILLLDGDVWINSAQAASDRLLADGTVRYKILYISDDPEQPIKSITALAGFQQSMDIPNARQGMQGRVKCCIEHMEYEILNSRKVNVKAIVSLSGSVANQTEQYITQDFDGVEGIQVLRSKISVNSYIGDGEIRCPVRDTLQVPAGKPAILEILRNDARIAAKEYKATENKVVVSGELNVSTLYIGDDEARSIQFMEHEVPFTQLIDIAGADENAYCNIDIELGDTLFEADEDSDGELRQLKCEAMLKIFAQCSGKKEIELAEDVYSPYSRISIEKEQLKLTEPVTENKSQAVLKETVETDADAPDIFELFNVLGRLSLSDSEITDDRVIIEGVVISNILYLANNEEQPIYCVDREIPFRQVVEVKGAKPEMSLSVEMDIENCGYSIVSTKEVELRYVIALNIRISKQILAPVIAKAAEQPLDEKRLAKQHSFTIYFTQQGDTLWKIAKKYYTTVDEIIKNNYLESGGDLSPGEQIIIPGRV